jgi:hydrogenase maturation protein HypF
MTIKLRVKGAVQGVGYRPFVANLAAKYNLKGYVKNLGAAVEILVAGDEPKVSDFVHCIENEYPSGAFILSVQKEAVNDLEQDYYEGFRIIDSETMILSDELPVFLPDIGICPDCMKEMLDKGNRRYRYPLISCASCGPRFSILDSLPYDRDTTTMIDFNMCPSCKTEYLTGRRRHAQTISCFDCGPQIVYKDISDSDSIDGEEAIKKAVSRLMDEQVIGLKGVSGYQLLCRPNDKAASLLRKIKGREEKPFAVMFSCIDEIRKYSEVNSCEEKLLLSNARPIVLLNTMKKLPYQVCKDSRYIGAFLPSAGIHRLLCDAVGPLIVTSANRSDEPIIIEDEDFFNTFKAEVSGVLYHKRRINVPQDDTVVYVNEIDGIGFLQGFIRRARGYTPLPVFVNNTNACEEGILSFGGDLKNTFAFAKKDRIILSQFLGDLKDYNINLNLKKLIKNYSEIFDFCPDKVICDMHPMYESSHIAEAYAKERNLPVYKVQHHHAHILSVMAEKSLDACIGVAFDGTGYGTDKNIWGGEFLYCKDKEFVRKGHLSYVKLCGGDNAPKNAQQVKQCYQYGIDEKSPLIPDLVRAALNNNIGCFLTSSAGRLFDAVSSLLDIRNYNSYEGECAVNLEKKAWEYTDEERPSLEFMINNSEDEMVVDQLKFFGDLAKVVDSKIYSIGAIAYSFHFALAKVIIDTCEIIRQDTSENKVCLSGGVFANRLLLKLTFEGLLKKGFTVYTNEAVPCGDSGISLGQAYYGLLIKD